MSDKHINLIADSIVYAVQNQRPKVTAILLKNGVIVPTGTTDAKLIILTSDVFRRSKPFQKDFASLIANSQYVSSSNFSGYSNAFGDYSVESIDFSLPKPTTSLTGASTLTSDSVLNSVPTVASSNNGSTTSPSFWSTSNIMGLFNTAANTYNTATTNQANIALANAATARAKAGIGDVAGTNIFGQPTVGAKAPAATSSNTTLYVILAIVAIGAIGGVVWYTSKSKK